YCLDGSGSMDSNGGWTGVQASVKLLFDPAQSSKYLLQIAAKDRTTVLVFSEGILLDVTVDGNSPAKLAELRAKLAAQDTDGGTAIYSCLQTAANKLAQDTVAGRKKLVVLMTDGQNNSGIDHVPDNILNAHVPVIAIAYGSDADSG